MTTVKTAARGVRFLGRIMPALLCVAVIMIASLLIYSGLVDLRDEGLAYLPIAHIAVGVWVIIGNAIVFANEGYK